MDNDLSSRLQRASSPAEEELAHAAVDDPASGAMSLTLLSVAVVVEPEVRRKRIVLALEREGLRVTFQASAAEALVAFDGSNIDVVVLAWDRVAAEYAPEVRLIRERLPSARIVLVAGSSSRRSLREVFHEGVDGLVLAENVDTALALAVRSACSGQVTLPSELREHVTRPALSPREKQILGMVVMGFTNAEIARQLHLAESTVKSHLSAAFTKLGVRSRAEATARILDPDAGLGTGILSISGEADPLGPN